MENQDSLTFTFLVYLNTQRASTAVSRFGYPNATAASFAKFGWLIAKLHTCATRPVCYRPPPPLNPCPVCCGGCSFVGEVEGEPPPLKLFSVS